MPRPTLPTACCRMTWNDSMCATRRAKWFPFLPFRPGIGLPLLFLCLAALYESWPIPISILLALPLGAIGGVIGSTLRGLPNDVYFQIGLLTTLGLPTKNAILIVQFAKARGEEEMGGSGA